MESPSDKKHDNPGSPANPANDDRQLRKEAALARRLAEAFDKIGTPSAGDCLDPEQIAAYQEHTISPEEAASCESHFATCSRCRKILAILAAGSDAPLADTEIAHLGELASPKAAAGPVSIDQGKSQAKPQPKSHEEFHAAPARRPRWLVPVFAAAAVLLLALLTRPLWHPGNSNRTEVAQAPAPSAPNAIATDSSAPSATPTPAADNATALPEAALPPVNPAAPEAVPKQPPATQTQAQVDALVRSASDLNAVSGLDKTEGAGKKAETSPTPAARSSMQTATGQGGGLSSAQAAPASPAPAAAPAPAPQSAVQVPRQAPAAGAFSGLYAGGDRPAGFAVILRVRNSRSAWRAGNGGRIEHSADGGQTWQMQQSPTRNEWLAGSAVSATICWLVGRNDAVARTSDGGQTWEPITAPSVEDSSGNHPDWVAVTATDADNATLTSRDQQRYATHDGGRTWEKQ